MKRKENHTNGQSSYIITKIPLNIR